MTRNKTELSLLTEHHSIAAKDLSDPAPSPSELKLILQAAMSVPDHGGLTPFRFLVIQGDARHELARVFEQASRQRNPYADEASVNKQKNKPLRSPMIIVVIARITENPSIPSTEQLLCAGCAAQHIQLACKILGYGSIWLSGDNCYDMNVYEALGVDTNERLVGFIYVGTPSTAPHVKPRPAAHTITDHWKKIRHSDFAI